MNCLLVYQAIQEHHLSKPCERIKVRPASAVYHVWCPHMVWFLCIFTLIALHAPSVSREVHCSDSMPGLLIDCVFCRISLLVSLWRALDCSRHWCCLGPTAGSRSFASCRCRVHTGRVW